MIAFMESPIDAADFDGALAAFRRAYPAFDTTRVLDELRAREYARLDRQGHIYLDYTGGGLYAESQLQEHMALLRSHVLAYFNASPDEYVAIFTPNASGALKLLGESYPFGPGDHYVLTADNHNSVNGIREFARNKGATVTYVPVVAPELRLDAGAVEQALGGARGRS